MAQKRVKMRLDMCLVILAASAFLLICGVYIEFLTMKNHNDVVPSTREGINQRGEIQKNSAFCPLYWRKQASSKQCCRNHRTFSPDYINVSGSDCIHLHYADKRNLPLTALASFPGSGNTWIRHLIQQTTGVYTGSIYRSSVLLGGDSFPGERYKDGRVIAIKTHSGARGEKRDPLYDRVVLILRDPFDAILAEFNRAKTKNKTAFLDREMFHSKGWKTFVAKKSSAWLHFNKSWLLTHPCVYVLLYQHMQEDLTAQMQQLALILGMSTPMSPEHLSCLHENYKGQYKREKPAWMQPAIKLYTKGQRDLLHGYIEEVNGYLQKYNVSIPSY